MPRVVPIKILTLAGLVFAISLTASSQTPSAPVPIQIIHGKKVFVSNAGSDAEGQEGFRQLFGDANFPYNQFYDTLKTWGRYDLVATPADADLIFEVRFTVPHAPPPSAPQMELRILDSQTHFTLWSLAETVYGGFRKASIRKNVKAAIDKVVDDVKTLNAQGIAAKDLPK